jgi:hypothetical protein
MKVIGVGLPRTGTWSLKLALEMLGFGPCYHMSEAFGDQASWPLWVKAGRGETMEWSQIFGRWGSTTDAPGCTFYKELAAYYPQAKLILTERDPHKWFASTQATILNPENHKPIGSNFGSAELSMGSVIDAAGWSPMNPDNHDWAGAFVELRSGARLGAALSVLGLCSASAGLPQSEFHR